MKYNCKTVCLKTKHKTGKLQCMDGVVVGNICYKLPYRVDRSVNYDTAASLCTFHGGWLAEIPTEQVYNAVYDYVKKNWYTWTENKRAKLVPVWLGSRYEVCFL